MEQGLASVKSAIEATRKERSGLKAEVKLVPAPASAGGGQRILLTTQGKAVHASIPEEGRNALWDLAAIADKLPLADNGSTAVLRTVARRFDGDHHGESLGFTGEDRADGAADRRAHVAAREGRKVSLGHQHAAAPVRGSTRTSTRRSTTPSPSSPRRRMGG